jgi:precorrin isomerase
MSEQLAYLRDGPAITTRSFAIIRAEADLSRFCADEAEVAIRMIHACGMVAAAEQIVFGPGLVGAARGALLRGAPILCDSEMVAHGITRSRLPARPGRRRSSAYPSVSSARRKQRRRWRHIRAACRFLLCAAASGEAP